MERAPAVSVIVVAYQSGPTLGRCLAALRAQTMQDFELLLVDNASSDGAPQAAAAADPSLRLLRMEQNLGFAAGNNRAAAVARGRWLALLNPDAFPAPDWLERLLAATAREPDGRLFTSLQLDDADPARMDGAGDVMTLAGMPYRGGYGHPARPLPNGEVFSPCGAAMLVARAAFEALGGFDERFFCYCEDVDLGYRARLRGWPTVLVPAAVVRHVGSATLGARSDFAVYHGWRNRLWAYLKNTPGPLLWSTLPLHVVATAVLLLLDGVARKGGPAWRGLRDGLRGLGPVLAERRSVQRTRTAGAAEILRALALNPLRLLDRRAVVRRTR